jgi:hypothetical protein
MKTFSSHTLLLLVSAACAACGGAAFTDSAESLADAGDVPDTAIVEADGGKLDASKDALATLDASDEVNTIDSATSDSAEGDTATVEDASAHDASVCTPIAGYAFNGCNGSHETWNVPAQYCNWVEQWGLSTLANTPAECMCQETYNCACLSQYVTCANCLNNSYGLVCGE